MLTIEIVILIIIIIKSNLNKVNKYCNCIDWPIVMLWQQLSQSQSDSSIASLGRRSVTYKQAGIKWMKFHDGFPNLFIEDVKNVTGHDGLLFHHILLLAHSCSHCLWSSEFLPCDAMLAWYMLSSWSVCVTCVCLYVYVSVTPCIVSKWLNLGSYNKQCHMIARGLEFSYIKGLYEIQTGLSLKGMPNAGGVGQNRWLSRNNSL